MANPLLTDEQNRRLANQNSTYNKIMQGFAPVQQPQEDSWLGGLSRGAKAGFGGVGAGLLHAGQAAFGTDGSLAAGFDAMAENNAQRRDWNLADTLSLDYLTNPDGLAYGIGQIAGSMALPALFGAGVAAAAPTGGASLLGTGALIGAAGAAPMAISEGGNTYAQGLQQGMTEDEAKKAGLTDAAIKLPFYMLSEGLSGKVAQGLISKGLLNAEGKSLGRRAAESGAKILGNAANEAYEEGTENRSSAYALGDQRISSLGNIFNPFDWNEEDKAQAVGVFTPTLALGALTGGAGHLRSRFDKKNSDVSEEIASEDGGTIEDTPNEENFWENKEAAKHSIQQAYADGLISKDDARVMLMKINDEELGEADKKRLKAREKQVAAVIESRRIQGYNDELDNYVNNRESGKEAFINAIAGQESGGDYGAVNGRTGASGKYQIMPENWPAWAEEAGLGADAEMTPENQEIVARYKLGEYYDKYGARGAAMAWYAGEGSLNYSEEALNRKQGNGDEPSINEYADSVLARMGNYADNARIDDTEENYFDESNSMGLPKLSAPTAKGFDVSHLVDEEAQDARELFGEKQDENIGKQNLGNDFFSNIKVEQDKRAKAIKDIARAVSQPNTFDGLRNSIPSNYLEQMQKARAVVPVNNNAVGRPIPSQTGTALTMQRGRNGGLNTDELAIMQKYQGNPDAFNRQFKKSVEAVRDAVNRGDITPDVGRAYMQNLGNMYNTVARTVQNDGVILQGQDPAIIKMLGNLRDKRRRGDTGVLPSLLQENGNADRSAAFANRNNPLAPLNLPVKTPKGWDKAEAEYKARAEEKAEKHTRQQTIVDIVNARAAQKWDEAETEYVSSKKGIDITLPKGVTVDAKFVKNKKTGKKEVELKFSGEKISDEFKKKLRAHGFNWNVGRKAWVAEENIVTKAVADKLTQKDNGEVKNGKEKTEHIDKTEERRGAEGDAGETKNSEAEQAEAEHVPESNQDEVNKKAVSVEENIANGQKAIERIIETHEDIENAMYRDDTGNIDFVWGREGTGAKFKHGYGLAHIIAKRNSENGNGIETAKKLVEVIAKGTKVERQESQNGDGEARLKIHYDGYTAVLSLSRDKNTWLLTGWEDNDAGSKKATVNASGEGYDSTTATTATPTLTRRNGETVASVTKSVAQPAENVKKINLPKGTTVDVSIVGDNSNIIQVKFNGAQGKGTGGIMGRAGYKWKSDKQVWQARKTEKAMDVAEQLGYTEEAKPQERDYELEYDELWDTFATKLGIDNILSVDKANEELKGVEGLHDGAIVYYDNNNRIYHIISKESDPEMLKLGYNYNVREFDIHHIPISIASVKTADEVIKRVTGRSEQKAEPKAKASADTFSKNPDALVKGDKVSSMPLSAMKFIKDMFDKGEARQNAKDAIRITLFKSKDLEASARNNTYDNFKIAYFDAAENYLADNVDNNPAYAKLLESGSFAKENMERAAKETYNLFRVGMEKQAEFKPAEKQETKEPATRFDGERARKSLDALIGRKKKSEPQKNDVVPKSKFMNVFNEDDLDAEIEKAKKEMSKLSANPMFNPALMKSLFKIGGIYLQKGVNKFAAWADNMVDVMGEKVRPFLPAVWDALKKYPDNQKFNDDVMTAVMEYVGEGVDNGKSLSAIKREFADDYGDEYLGYVDAAFEGVKKYPTSDNVADVVESKQDNTEGGKENGTDGQTIQTGNSSGSGAVRRGVSSSGKAVHAGGRGSERPDSLLGREPSEDGGTSEETGNSSRVRDREHNQSGRPVGKESEFGNVHNGRKGERSAEQTDVAGSVGRRSRGTDGGRTGVTTNYHIEDPDALIGGTPKVRFLRNKKAIEVAQELLDNDRSATKEERNAMAAYTGWGSFGQELFQGTWEKPIYKDGWKEENDWLRDTLGKDAWEEAQNSIINAHYTDPYTINSMWEMAKNMGFKGGKVLEPSMGVGNFFGLMPKGIAEKSQLTGIELDRTTGRMAQALYPQANIQIKGYEESRTPDNFYDMIIGNVPFGNFNIADRRYGKLKPLIHDFFFLKGIDQLKPGGIMMAITTKGTLDKADARVRMELAKKADLVAAYRLPTGAFDKYAGTNVVTDILIFKKLDKPRTGVRELEWVNSSKYQTTFRGQQETYYYNDYFKNHPENVLGIMEFGHGTTTGRPGLTVKRLDDFGERLKEIPNEVPKNIFEADKAQDNIQYISNHKGGEQGSVTTENGKLYTVYGDQLKPLADTKKYSVKSDKQTAQRIQEINDWIKLRDTLGALYDAERTDAANMEELRAELNKVFDDYCAKYVKQGKWNRKDKDEQPPFRQSYVNKYMKSIEEPSAARVMALVDDNGNKTAIFSKRSVRGSNTDIKNPTISQALIMQRNENVSNLDIDRIAELAKKSKADVISELTKSGTIFKTPAGNYEVKDVYLSGNVRQKLREAEDALQSGDKDMQANIEALKKVIPETVPYYNISTSMGATWIPQDVYRQFIAHLLSVDSIDNIKLTRTKGYSVELGKGYNNLNAATTVYGLSEIPFSKLLTHAFNHTKPVITMRKSGEVVEDTEAMNKANDKLEKIYDEFNDWLWKDNSRKLQLEHEYNEIMNAIAVPTYDGSFMDMPGMALLRGNSQFNLRQHQLNAIYRGLINGSGVYAHEVGTGKTYTMAGLAIESRRYGLAKKPLLLAFNANSASVAKEINDMYPGAKVLYIDNLDRKNIKLKLEQIRTDDWDCVVMPHSLVDKLSFKEDTLMAMAEQQIYELEQAAIEAAEQDGEKISVEQMEKMRTAGKDEKVKGVRSTTAKKLVTMRNKIINQIKQSALNASAEDAISFEDLGIDMVLVDEAHAFKKPPFATTRKIKGLTTESSNRSIQLSFITQYIQSINNGRGVHLFTGTPITNTLTEMYHMMRYVMPKAMEDAGIKDFDSWMNSFAEETADMEFTSTGDVEMVSRLASFTNVPELRRFVGQYWDTVFADDMPEFKPRETASGKTITDKLTDEEQDELLNGYTEEPQGRPYKKVIVETLKLTNSQNTILNDLVKKAKRYKDATKQERKKIARQEFHATPLLISNDASLAGMDPRLYDININTQGEETKIDRCVSNVAKIYKEGTDAHPTVQVIFTDVGYSDTKTRSIPQRTGFGEGDFKSVKETVPTFNMAKALVKQLTEQGIPENEIVVMKASYSPEKRAQIADMLKTGKYRVVIGSTATLGVGVNMQDNLRAMHHLDCPWMPGDLTQRNGRGHRQGNHWNTVLEYRYVTEKLDTKRWQTVLRKDAFINSFMKSKVGDNSVRAFEMGADDMNDKDTDSDLLQTLSEASGDPRVLIQKKYETNLAKLERKERTFIAGIEDIKGRLKYIDSVIEHKKDEWNALSADAETFVANKKADFEIKLVSSLKVGASRKLVTFDNRTDAQKHLGDILKQVMDIGVDNRIGEYTGFEVVVRKEASSIDGTYQPVIRLNGATTHLCGTPSIGGIASKAANIPGRVGKAQTAYEQAKKDKTELQKAAQETFPQQKQLDKTRKQLEEVKQDRMLSPTPPPEWLVNGVTLSSTFYVDDKPYSLSGYRANSDGYYLVGEANGEQRVFPFQDATDIQGMKVYDMTNHVPSPAYKAPSAEDIKNATANNTQYSVYSEAVQRAKEEVEAEIKKALPGAELEQREDGSYIATMPNGKRLGIVIEEQILLNERQAEKAGEAHNRAASEAEGYWSRWEQLDSKNIDGVIRVSRNSRVGTAFHETLHAAMDLCLTDKEKAALYKAFAKKAKESGRSVDEEIADAYKEWAIKRQSGQGSMFGKLFQKAKDFLNKLYTMFVEADNKGNIFRKLESGEAWKQQTYNASEAPKFNITSADIKKFINAALKNPAKHLRMVLGKVSNAEAEAIKKATGMDVQNFTHVWFSEDVRHIKNRHGVGNEKDKRQIGLTQEDIEKAIDVIKSPDRIEKGTTDKGRESIRFMKANSNGEYTVVEVVSNDKKQLAIKTMWNKKEAATTKRHADEISPQYTSETGSGNTASVSDTVSSNSQEVKYSVAPAQHKIANAFTNTERKGTIETAKDFIKEQKKNWYTDLIDKNHILKSFDQLTKTGLSVYDQVQNLPSTTAGMLKAICEGNALSIKAANQHLKNVKMKYNVTLAMALAQIDKKTMDKAQPKYLAANGFDSWVNAFGAYLGAERLLEMNDLAKADGKVYKFPKGLTEAELRAFTRNAPEQFRKAADMFYKVNDNMISVMEDAQVFSHDLAQQFRTKYKKYCPLLRDFSDTAAADTFINGLTEGGRGIGNVSVPLKKINIEGSERGVLNPLESVLKSYSVMLNRAERNKVGLMAVNAAKTAQLHDLIKEVPEVKGKDGKVVNAVADPKNCIFTVLVNGKKKAYQTTQELYSPIVGYNLPAAGLCINVARMAAHMLRTGATMSPSFIVRNFLRDTIFASISSKNGFVPFVDSIRGALALWNDPAMRAEFEAAGVTEFNFYGSQNARIKSIDAMAGENPVGMWQMAKWLFTHMEAASDFVESSTRMGEFMKAKEKGLSMEEAARAAREVTLDFSRSGVVGEQINRYVPFFNACLQGGDKMVRLFREDFVGTSLKVFKYIMLPSLLIMAMNWDEDWYKDLDPDIKNNYWCVGRNIRIPKPQEAGVLFGSGIEALFEQAASKDKDAVENWLKVFRSNMIPSIVPTIFLPVLEWQANYSYFKGRQIVGSKYQRLPDELQYNDYTSELSKGIGSALKVSPMKIDNLVRGYTGTMGALLWGAAGEPFAKANNLPAKHFNEILFVRDFNVTDANLSRPMNEFYGILDKANRQHAGYGVKGKPEAAVKGIRSAGAMISKIRKDIDKITHSNLTPERKRELIDKRKEKMNQIAKQANARYGKYFD